MHLACRRLRAAVWGALTHLQLTGARARERIGRLPPSLESLGVRGFATSAFGTDDLADLLQSSPPSLRTLRCRLSPMLCPFLGVLAPQPASPRTVEALCISDVEVVDARNLVMPGRYVLLIRERRQERRKRLVLYVTMTQTQYWLHVSRPLGLLGESIDGDYFVLHRRRYGLQS